MRQKTRRVLRLRRLRRDREMSQRALAKLVGLEHSFICEIELGRKNPTLEKAREIAAVFGLPIEEVFSYVEVPA